jgi:hypothetical protein
MDIATYMLSANRCFNELESFTGKRWNIPPWPKLVDEIMDTQDPFRVHLPCYDYLVYLRHHGFPSPLLDWTTSAFVAAYFAYTDALDADRVAVYMYVSTTTGFRAGDPQLAKITVQGPFTTTHPRHFTQKAVYTIATVWSKEELRHYFCPHGDVFSRADEKQDVLIKITLPNEQRAEALSDLDQYNINHFTLFQTDDALVRALGMKQFDMQVDGEGLVPAGE